MAKVQLPVFGFTVECKDGEGNLFYIKINTYSESEAIQEVTQFVNNNYSGACIVVRIDKSYTEPFTGIIN